MDENLKAEWLDEMFRDETFVGEQSYKRRKRKLKEKKCKCPKSKCLKLYCICFAAGKYCDGCQCVGCENDQDHQAERNTAINWILEKKPDAFNPKVGASLSTSSTGKLVEEGEKAHLKGCSCKSCNCQQNYCECFSAGVLCSRLCKCHSCKNDEVVDSSGFGGSIFRAMPLASAADARPSNNFSDEGSDVLEISKEAYVDIRKQPWFYITDEFIKKTSQSLCNVAGQEGILGPVEVQRNLLHQFGSLLDEIIDMAKSYNPSKPAIEEEHDEIAPDLSQTPSLAVESVEEIPLVFKTSEVLDLVKDFSVQPSAGTSSKGCSCKSCSCVRKFCECYRVGVLCCVRCKCYSCKNNDNLGTNGLLDIQQEVNSGSMRVPDISMKQAANQVNSTLPTGMYLRNRDQIKLKNAQRLRELP